MIFSKEAYEAAFTSTNYEGRCGNCHECFHSDDDLYCIYCGTPRGKGDFKPYLNVQDCVYGSPSVFRYTCMKCGYMWKESTLGGFPEVKYCPKCGLEINSEKLK